MLTKGINKDDTETSINDLIDSSSERNPSVEGNSSIVRAMSPKQKDKKMPLFVFKKVKPENKAKIKAGNEGGSAFSTDDQKRSDITDKERTTIAAILMS